MARQRTPEELAKMAANAQKVKAKADAAFEVTKGYGRLGTSLVFYCSRCGVARSISGPELDDTDKMFFYFGIFKKEHEHILPSR